MTGLSGEVRVCHHLRVSGHPGEQLGAELALAVAADRPSTRRESGDGGGQLSPGQDAEDHSSSPKFDV